MLFLKMRYYTVYVGNKCVFKKKNEGKMMHIEKQEVLTETSGFETFLWASSCRRSL